MCLIFRTFCQNPKMLVDVYIHSLFSDPVLESFAFKAWEKELTEHFGIQELSSVFTPAGTSL